MIAGAILLALWLISLVRVKVWLRYEEAGLLVKVLAGPVRITVFPLKVRPSPQRARRKRKGPSPRAPVDHPKPGGGNLALVQQFLPLLGEAAGRFRRKVRIERIYLDLLWGGCSPAGAALGYGCANAALGMLWPILEHNFHIRDRRIRTAIDFQRSTPALWVEALASLTVGQGLALALILGWKAVAIYSNSRKAEKIKEAV